MKKLITLIILVAGLAFTASSQALYLETDTMTITGTNDSIVRTWYLAKIVFNFEAGRIEWHDKVATDTKLTDTTFTYTSKPWYKLIAGDSVEISGTYYTAGEVLEALLDAGDRTQAKAANRALKDDDPKQYLY